MKYFEEIKTILQEKINSNSNQFFTEHDVHSEIYSILTEITTNLGYKNVKTRDGFLVNTVHHEYPTPFRCYMKDGSFQIKNDNEKGYDRAKIDCVVLNPDFIRNQDLQIVAGKDYSRFKENELTLKHPVLETALEVMYYPFEPITRRKNLGKGDIAPLRQEYLKLKSIIDYNFLSEIPFTKEAGFLILSNYVTKNDFQRKMSGMDLDDSVKMQFISKY